MARTRSTFLALATAAFAAGCAPASPGLPASTSPSPTPSPEVSGTLLAVGDIGSCDGEADEAVAALADARPDAPIALLGDIAYPDGRRRDFNECFDPAWGPMLDHLRPVPGNHEYRTNNASGYFSYFGDAAATPGEGWYAYRLGEWLILALNSNCDAIGGCGADSPQYAWLAERLEGSPACTLAYWHHPRLSSGKHGDTPRMAAIWDVLADHGAELVLSGHDHTYERMALMDGLRQFVVGTGGRSLYPFESTAGPMSEARADDTYGLLELTLRPDGYAWEFVPAPGVGGSFTDAGEGTCAG